MKKQITVKDWLTLDEDTRRQLSQIFSVGKSGIVEVVDNKLVSDGTTYDNLRAMDIGSMVYYVRDLLPWYSEDLCDTLFKLVQDKFYGRIGKQDGGGTESVVNGSSDAGSRASEGAQPRRAGRPRKEPGAVSVAA